MVAPEPEEPATELAVVGPPGPTSTATPATARRRHRRLPSRAARTALDGKLTDATPTPGLTRGSRSSRSKSCTSVWPALLALERIRASPRVGAPRRRRARATPATRPDRSRVSGSGRDFEVV